MKDKEILIYDNLVHFLQHGEVKPVHLCCKRFLVKAYGWTWLKDLYPCVAHAGSKLVHTWHLRELLQWSIL